MDESGSKRHEIETHELSGKKKFQSILVVLTVFWDIKETITIDFLERKSASVNSASDYQLLRQYFILSM